MKNRDFTISKFYRLEKDEKVAITCRVKTLQGLSLYIMRNFLESNSLTLTKKNKVKMIDWIISKQKTGVYTRENSLDNISALIMSCYVLFKDEGKNPLNTKEIKQLTFLIKKDLETAIEFVKLE